MKEMTAMREPSFARLNCSIARSLAALGDAWSLLILRDALTGARTFEGFQRRLGIARNTLTDRLRHLVEEGMLTQMDVGKRGTRFEYVPTQKAKDFQVPLMAIMQWGDRWVSGQGNEPVIAVDRNSGATITPLAVRTASGRAVSSDELMYRPGKGATTATRDYLTAKNKRLVDSRST
jgi:DNA-binding HxlR family transcriptional regulator